MTASLAKAVQFSSNIRGASARTCWHSFLEPMLRFASFLTGLVLARSQMCDCHHTQPCQKVRTTESVANTVEIRVIHVRQMR